MKSKALQVASIAVITAAAIHFVPVEGPIPFARQLFAVFFAVLQGTLTFVWLSKGEASGQHDVAEVRNEVARLMRENSSLKGSVEELKEKSMKSSTTVASLAAIAKITGASLDLQKLLESIMETVGSMGAARASLWLVEGSSQGMKLANSVGWPDSEKNTEVRIGEGIVGWVAETGNAVDPGAIQRDPALMDIKKRSKFPSVLCVPLVNNQEKLGALNIETLEKKKEGANLSDEMRLITFLASLAAMAIKNAKVFGVTKEFAEKDGLTKLFNHRYYQDSMDRELKRADRYGDPVSILLTDIDKFKSFNDTYGHQVGDQVLAQTAKLLADLARESDIPCRYGGEEFVLILPQTGKRGAAQMAERLRSAVENAVYKTSKGDLRVTLSVGVACFPDDGREKGVLVKLADEALYRAKQGGRNRVELAQPDGASPLKEAHGKAAPEPAPAPAPPKGGLVLNPGPPQGTAAFIMPAGVEGDSEARLERAQAAAIAKARALAQAGDTEKAREAADLARRIAAQRTALQQAVDPNLAAKARAAAKIAAQRKAEGEAGSQDPSARAAQVRRTASQAVPSQGDDGKPEGS